jgi:beta-galactosidase
MLSGGGFASTLSAADSPREHLSLDAGWKFHLGEDWPKALRLDKADANSGPASEKLFSDVAWRTVKAGSGEGHFGP